MTEIDPRLARYSVSELETMASMAQDVVDEGGPFAAQSAARLAEYRAVIALRTGRVGAPTTPVVSDYTEIGRRGGSAASNQFGTFSVHEASDKQVGFLRKLIAEKDTTGVTIPADLTGISKKSASALIDKLIDRPAKAAPANTTAPTGRPASEKQVGFIRSLIGRKDLTGTAYPAWDDAVFAQLTSREASAAIDHLNTLPGKPVAQQAPAAKIAAGAYRLADGRIVRVYLGQQSGRMLCQELLDPTAKTREEAWKYLGQAERFVSADAHRMTPDECEQASAGTQDHGWCCVCGRELDDPKSVARGIGPICRGKQGAI